jgi:hypothetical protein
MTWIADTKCTEFHAYDLATTYSSYIYGSFGGDGTSMANSYAIGTSFSTNSPSQKQVEQFHFVTSDKIHSIKYARYAGVLLLDDTDDKETWDLKFSFSATCSVWARPTTTVLTEKVGAVGFTIGPSIPYDFGQVRFNENHCQKLKFQYTSTLYKLDSSTPPVPIYTKFADMTAPKWIVNFDPSTLIYTFNP